MRNYFPPSSSTSQLDSCSVDEVLPVVVRRVPLATLSATSRHNVSSQSDLFKSNSPNSNNTRIIKPKFDVDVSKENTSFFKSSPQPPTKKLKLRQSWSEFRQFISTPSEIEPKRKKSSPFPVLSWADKDEIWKLICKKEFGMYKRLPGEDILNRHQSLRPRMRAILLDWLIEVCEVHRLHRETFYLAVDFIDRYLTVTTDMPKNRLQLIGISCLFIGSKIEEIYPPKLEQFAYVTDGACTAEQILDMELVILKALNWGLSPMTPNSWMKLFMQVTNCDKTPCNENFVLPQYSGLSFSRVMQLLDLCTMDMGSLSFKYSVLVAAALYHFENETVALAASGYEWKDIATCVNWMSAYAFALREESPLQPRSFHNVNVDNQHNIQTHTMELSMLDRAQSRLALLMTVTDRDSPDPSEVPPIPLASLELTPPDEEGDVVYHHHVNSATNRNVFMSPPAQDGDAW